MSVRVIFFSFLLSSVHVCLSLSLLLSLSRCQRPADSDDERGGVAEAASDAAAVRSGRGAAGRGARQRDCGARQTRDGVDARLLDGAAPRPVPGSGAGCVVGAGEVVARDREKDAAVSREWIGIQRYGAWPRPPASFLLPLCRLDLICHSDDLWYLRRGKARLQWRVFFLFLGCQCIPNGLQKIQKLRVVRGPIALKRCTDETKQPSKQIILNFG